MGKLKKNSVHNLVVNNLCYQCGTCKSICPTKAIEMKKNERKGCIYPNVNNDKCISCGKCLKVCPINNIKIQEKHFPEDNDYIAIYNSTDEARLDYTASGGLVTEIISYLFSEKKITKAIVTGMDNENAINGKVHIIEDVKNLKQVSGSVYQPVSVNEALEHISPNDKVAFVGLPCHIRGLNLFLKEDMSLANVFVVKIGLICTIGRGKHGTDLTLVKDFKLKNNELKNIKELQYRYGVPPGEFKILLNDGEYKSISGVDFLQNTDYFFMPKGCLFCNDLFNDCADITVGDPWGMKKGKKSMAIVRNEKIREVLQVMTDKKLLQFDSIITAQECIDTQQHSVNYKVFNYSKRITAYAKVGCSIPVIDSFEINKVKNTFVEHIGYNLLMFNSLIFNSRVGFFIARYTPKKLLFKYRNIILNINTKRGLE